MVNNYDRIFDEITAEAERIGIDNDLSPETLVELVMEIVDTEDRNRIKPIGINKEITNSISQVAINMGRS